MSSFVSRQGSLKIYLHVIRSVQLDFVNNFLIYFDICHGFKVIFRLAGSILGLTRITLQPFRILNVSTKFGYIGSHSPIEKAQPPPLKDDGKKFIFSYFIWHH